MYDEFCPKIGKFIFNFSPTKHSILILNLKMCLSAFPDNMIV